LRAALLRVVYVLLISARCKNADAFLMRIIIAIIVRYREREREDCPQFGETMETTTPADFYTVSILRAASWNFLQRLDHPRNCTPPDRRYRAFFNKKIARNGSDSVAIPA